MGMIFSLLI